MNYKFQSLGKTYIVKLDMPLEDFIKEAEKVSDFNLEVVSDDF